MMQIRPIEIEEYVSSLSLSRQTEEQYRAVLSIVTESLKAHSSGNPITQLKSMGYFSKENEESEASLRIAKGFISWLMEKHYVREHADSEENTLPGSTPKAQIIKTGKLNCLYTLLDSSQEQDARDWSIALLMITIMLSPLEISLLNMESIHNDGSGYRLILMRSKRELIPIPPMTSEILVSYLSMKYLPSPDSPLFCSVGTNRRISKSAAESAYLRVMNLMGVDIKEVLQDKTAAYICTYQSALSKEDSSTLASYAASLYYSAAAIPRERR